MTIWFVIPGNKEKAFRAAYLDENVRGKDNPNEDEKVGTMVPNADGSKLFTGSSRIDLVKSNSMKDKNPPWVEVHTTPDFMDKWEWPVE